MLILSLFSACEKVLLDPIDDQLSLVGIGTNVYALGTVQHPEGSSELVKECKYALPTLTVSTFWLAPDEDSGAKFEQRIEIIAEDGRKVEIGPPIKFTVSRGFHRIVQKVDITCRSSGVYKLALFVRPEEGEWNDAAGLFTFRALPPRDSNISVNVKEGPARIEA